MKTGLQPRDFKWVIKDRLATSARIGGQGFQHRRVRREEEITWLVEAGFTTVVSLLPGTQNVRNYETAGLEVYLAPVDLDPEPARPRRCSRSSARLWPSPGRGSWCIATSWTTRWRGCCRVRGFCRAGDDPRVAAMVIQEIIGRPLGPTARALIPPPGFDRGFGG